MPAQELKDLLLWSLAVNYGVLLIWAGLFMLAHGWLMRMHTRWFSLSAQTFDAMHYAGMGLYKLGIMLLNVAPLLALVLSQR